MHFKTKGIDFKSISKLLYLGALKNSMNFLVDILLLSNAPFTNSPCL